MKLDVYNIQGEKTGRKITLSDDIFGIEPNEHTIYLAVKQYMAHQRQGTHKTKERGEIRGSTRKIKRQKGTGTARAGSIKNPLFRGGGRVFGPKPRTYEQKLNKKVRRLARFSALSSKAADDKLMIIEDFTFDAPQTSEFVKILKNFSLDGVRSKLVTSDEDKALYLSARNLQKTGVVTAMNLNTYEVVKANTLLVTESAIEKIHEAFAKK